jgi:3-methyladenine DNA glycosylase/8-oxoguanine DNA glycosylase
MPPDAVGSWPLPSPYDFVETTRLLRTGPGDPTLRREADGLWRTAHTTLGPATVRVRVGPDVQAHAWGPGSAAAMADAPRWLGLHEPAWQLTPHPVVDRLLRQYPGLRSTDTRDVFEALVAFVLQQLVTWQEATRTWQRLCLALGEPAPGPTDLRLSPTPKAILSAGTANLQATGVGPGQARTLMEVARVAHAVRRAADLPTDEADALLQKVRGIGPWTSAMVLGVRLGRPEPIPVGDFHLRDTIGWVLASEPRATDARMVELLEPFRGQAFRVIRLVSAARLEAPKRGPRFAWRRNGRG